MERGKIPTEAVEIWTGAVGLLISTMEMLFEPIFATYAYLPET